ncbi:hypothetical protein pb186bvf_018644 [Paramecium bursaria]
MENKYSKGQDEVTKQKPANAPEINSQYKQIILKNDNQRVLRKNKNLNHRIPNFFYIFDLQN